MSRRRENTPKKHTTRGRKALYAINVGVLVAAVFFMPSFGGSRLDAAMAGDSPSGVRDVGEGDGPTPAEQALTEIAQNLPGAIPGWTPGSATRTVDRTTAEINCGNDTSPAPVAGVTQSWSSPQGVTVTLFVHAYSAGQGAAWFERMGTEPCDSDTDAAAAAGVEAWSYAMDKTSALLWRHGDIVATATSTSADLPEVAGFVDPTLLAALTGRCADPVSTIAADTGRNPHIDGDKYTGLLVGEPRTVPAENRVAPTGWDSSPVPPVTPLQTLPTKIRTAPTPSPLAMPTTVKPPTAPVAPAAPSETYLLFRQVADKDGPGCGWKFTGTKAPKFDKKKADKAFDDSADDAKAAAINSWDQYWPAVTAYRGAVTAYEPTAAAFNTYVSDVMFTVTVWDAVDAARTAYTTAKTAFDAQQATYAAAMADRTAAQTRYDEDLEYCQKGSFPAGVTRPAPTCPAVKPVILNQPAPVAPVPPAVVDEAKIVADLQATRPVPVVPAP